MRHLYRNTNEIDNHGSRRDFSAGRVPENTGRRVAGELHGLVYEGPGMVSCVNRGLVQLLKRWFKTLSEAVRPIKVNQLIVALDWTRRTRTAQSAHSPHWTFQIGSRLFTARGRMCEAGHSPRKKCSGPWFHDILARMKRPQQRGWACGVLPCTLPAVRK